MEVDINGCIEQLERSIKILMPGDELFNSYDFNIKTTHELMDFEESTDNSAAKCSNQDDENGELERPSDDDDDDDDDDSEDDFVEVSVPKTKEEIENERSEEMKYLGISKDGSGLQNKNQFEFTGQLKIDLHLKENDENKVVFEIIRGLYKELKNSHLIKVNDWIKLTETRDIYFKLARFSCYFCVH